MYPARPAYRIKRIKDGEPGIIILSHVDDLEVFATKREFEDLEKLKAEGLKVKVEGPLERTFGSIGFLKRTFTAIRTLCKVRGIVRGSASVRQGIFKETPYSRRWWKSNQ